MGNSRKEIARNPGGAEPPPRWRRALNAVAVSVIGNRVNGVRVVPVATKIIALFVFFLLLSNLVSNFLNSALNQAEIKKLVREILIKDLGDFNTFCNHQADVYRTRGQRGDSLRAMEARGMEGLKDPRSILLGIRPDSDLAFLATRGSRPATFDDHEALKLMLLSKTRGRGQDSLAFRFEGRPYYGYFKYNPAWDLYLVKAEEEGEFKAASRRIYWISVAVVAGITLVAAILGVLLLQQILKYIGRISSAMMDMNSRQKLELIPLEGAPNDDITYLGISFNSLAATIDTLLKIFRKFVAQDLTEKAYREKRIKLEGTRRDLTILFTDIKNFTTMTESLKTDIIRLLNIHYSKTIHEIGEHHGIIGSIIGDALLAIYGVERGDEAHGLNKSLAAVRSAYRIHELAAETRELMARKKRDLLGKRKRPDAAHERIFRAVSLEVGVGIDGGEVFYGTIGSYEQMTNTVIGDNVNAASRLEGLTRFYKVPVICSDYVKRDVEENGGGVRFVELDTVKVKGKTEGKRVYWPILEERVSEALSGDLARFEEGLALYYKGRWAAALGVFKRSPLPMAEVFRERTAGRCPPDWKGLWTMTSK